MGAIAYTFVFLFIVQNACYFVLDNNKKDFDKVFQTIFFEQVEVVKWK